MNAQAVHACTNNTNDFFSGYLRTTAKFKPLQRLHLREVKQSVHVQMNLFSVGQSPWRLRLWDGRKRCIFPAKERCGKFQHGGLSDRNEFWEITIASCKGTFGLVDLICTIWYLLLQGYFHRLEWKWTKQSQCSWSKSECIPQKLNVYGLETGRIDSRAFKKHILGNVLKNCKCKIIIEIK